MGHYQSDYDFEEREQRKELREQIIEEVNNAYTNGDDLEFLKKIIDKRDSLKVLTEMFGKGYESF